MKISVVTTMYQSALYIMEFYERIKATLNNITNEQEIIIVNDGSKDSALDLAVSISEGDSSVRVIDLSRNFGHHKAVMEGLKSASGDLIFLIDCDLEEAPESLDRFHEEWVKYEGKVDVVYGVQQKREGGWFRCWAGSTFYTVYNFLSGESIPRNLSLTRLMTFRYVQSLILHAERNLVLSGIFQLTGFVQVPIEITKPYKGTTTYSVRKRFSLLVDSITSFSNRPLIAISLIGFLFTVLSFCLGFYLVFIKFFRGVSVEGWVSIVISIWFIGGLVIFFLGIVGLYIAKIYIEVKARPNAIVRHVYQRLSK